MSRSQIVGHEIRTVAGNHVGPGNNTGACTRAGAHSGVGSHTGACMRTQERVGL